MLAAQTRRSISSADAPDATAFAAEVLRKGEHRYNERKPRELVRRERRLVLAHPRHSGRLLR